MKFLFVPFSKILSCFDDDNLKQILKNLFFASFISTDK